MSTTSSSSSGIGLGGLVFAIFLTLKLAEIGPVAEWSWWWVTSPLWISALSLVGLALGVVLGAVATEMIKDRRRVAKAKALRNR